MWFSISDIKTKMEKTKIKEKIKKQKPEKEKKEKQAKIEEKIGSKKTKEKIYVVSGKRKTSIAKAKISPGKGIIKINNVPYELLHDFHRLAIEEPLRIAKNEFGNLDFNIDVKVFGGGRESQIQASRLAITKAILMFSKSEKLKRAFLNYDRNLLVADVRRKEAYKPGDSKARKKRQKSYR